MTTQQDADLIREANETAAAMKATGQTFTAELLRRAAAQLEELTQPAPGRCACGANLYINEHGQPCSRVEQPAPQPDDSKAYPLPQHLNVTTHKDGTILAVTVNDSDGRIVQVLAEAPQPAPLALSAEDASEWAWVCASTKHLSPKRARAILAVDALLRRRVQRLTDVKVAVVEASTATGLWYVRVDVDGVGLTPTTLHSKGDANILAARLRTALGITDHSGDGNEKVGEAS